MLMLSDVVPSEAEASPFDLSPPPHRSLLSRVPNWVWTLLIAVVGIGLLELAARREVVSDLILPRPTDVWNALVDGFRTGLYWKHIASTLWASAAGFLVAAVIGVLMAGIIISVERLEQIVVPFVIAFQTVPKVAVAPLIVLWLGFDEKSKVVIVAIVCFFPILVNSMQGMRIQSREQLELMRSVGATKWQLFRMLRVPGSLPYVFAGFHIGVVFSVLGAVVAEFVGSPSGLGYLLLIQKGQFNVPGVYAVIVLLMIIGLTMHGIMVALERKVAFWARDITNVAV